MALLKADEVCAAFEEFETLGGTEGIDAHWERERQAQNEEYIPDEDGEIAYEAMMDAWATSEDCPDWAR